MEGAYARVSDRPGGIFQAGSLYGKTSLWSVTLALRLAAGTFHRMGRYGVWADALPEHDAMRMR